MSSLHSVLSAPTIQEAAQPTRLETATFRRTEPNRSLARSFWRRTQPTGESKLLNALTEAESGGLTEFDIRD